MKYSLSQFPNSCDITGVLHEIWDNGWFDEYSAQHLLIKAICDKTIDFRRKNEIIQSSINMHQNCDNADTFIANISSCLYQLKQHCSEDVLKKYIKQLAAGKENYSEEQFFDTLHELQVFRFFCSRMNVTSVEYEPPIGGVSGRKNPEYRINASFQLPGKEPGDVIIPQENYTFDIEVKTVEGRLNKKNNPLITTVTPIIPIDYNKRDKLEHLCKEYEIQLELPDVIQLRDFLNDAACKFDSLASNENHFNFLFLNWTFREISERNFIEPLMLLYNEYNGLFRYPELGKKFGLKNEVFEKISAIVIYSSPIQGVMFNDTVWALSNNQYRVLLNSSLNNKQKIQMNHILRAETNNSLSKYALLVYPPNLNYWLIEELFDSIDETIKDIMFK